MQQQLKKIVVLGPESTGKSTLCKQLANHYHTLWCPEFARGYLLQHGTNYSFYDLLTIAKGQLALEEEYVALSSEPLNVSGEPLDMRGDILDLPYESPLTTHYSRFLFLDTDLYVMKVWCEFVFGKCHPFILDQIAERKYDLYLLCKPDLPWIKDELREYPDLESRERLYHIYKDLLINQTTPWVEISGDYDERLTKAIAAVDGILMYKTHEF